MGLLQYNFSEMRNDWVEERVCRVPELRPAHSEVSILRGGLLGDSAVKNSSAPSWRVTPSKNKKVFKINGLWTCDWAANQGVVGSNPASRARICVLDQRVEHFGVQPVFLWLGDFWGTRV